MRLPSRSLALAAACCAALGGTGILAAPAQADTIGGEQLASTHRTVQLGPGAKPLPDVWAQTWVLADATTGEVLAAKGAHVQRAPASTLKTLTALTVIPQTSPDQTWVATPKAAYSEGSRVGLKVGRPYTLEQLWYAVFLPSANDAAIGVAQANGSVKKTVRQMNAVAAGLQARDTVAKSPNGLDHKGQVSSAYDLALIGRAAMQLPQVRTYAGTAEYEFPDVKGKGEHPIHNTNRLLLSGFTGITGLKTGFTSEAGRTYVGTATRGGTSLIVTMMGIHESTEAAARKLLRWGFKNHDKVTPIGTLVDPLSPDATAATRSEGDPTAGAVHGEGASAGASTTAEGGDPTTAAVLAQPTSTASAITYGAAFLIVAALAAGGFMLVRQRMGRYRGRHAGR